jgi:hypothetical protein
MFYLARRVKIDPDPSLLPTEADLNAAIESAVSSYFARATSRTSR